MTTEMIKVWFEDDKLIMQHVPEADIYKREWVGLTAGEIHDIEGYKETREMYRFARDLEAKLKEKNNERQ